MAEKENPKLDNTLFNDGVNTRYHLISRELSEDGNPKYFNVNGTSLF